MHYKVNILYNNNNKLLPATWNMSTSKSMRYAFKCNSEDNKTSKYEYTV